VAPSATLYVRAVERQRADSRRPPGRGLVIGDPAVNRRFFSELSSLGESAQEAAVVAKRSGAALLTGGGAVKSAILTAAPRADWIHFSGHALIDPRHPLRSKLVLAADAPDDPGVLTAQEVYALRLDRTRLVVLAACDTGDEYIPGSEGVTSLARAFLAAGVPTVVASLWSVDDKETSVLFDAFHQAWASRRDAVAEGARDPVDALRAAQLAMIHSSQPADRSPRAWAAFEVLGASAQ
jgi:CHAT domain-containing protein